MRHEQRIGIHRRNSSARQRLAQFCRGVGIGSLLFALTYILLVTPATAQPPKPPAPREILGALHERWVRAIQTENLGDLANIYLKSDELRFINSRRTLRLEGWKSVRHTYDSLFAGTQSVQLDVFHRDVVVFDGTGIVAAYIEITAATSKETLRYLLRQTQVYHKFSDAWKVVHEHLSEVKRPSP